MSAYETLTVCLDASKASDLTGGKGAANWRTYRVANDGSILVLSNADGNGQRWERGDWENTASPQAFDCWALLLRVLAGETLRQGERVWRNLKGKRTAAPALLGRLSRPRNYSKADLRNFVHAQRQGQVLPQAWTKALAAYDAWAAQESKPLSETF